MHVWQFQPSSASVGICAHPGSLQEAASRRSDFDMQPAGVASVTCGCSAHEGRHRQHSARICLRPVVCQHDAGGRLQQLARTVREVDLASACYARVPLRDPGTLFI